MYGGDIALASTSVAVSNEAAIAKYPRAFRTLRNIEGRAYWKERVVVVAWIR
jgi:hypothetical protein